MSEERYPSYRWLILFLLLVALMAQPFNNYGITAMYSQIQTGLSLNHAQMGLLSSIIGLCLAIFAFAGGAIMSNIGIKMQYTIALGLLAIGGIALGFAPTYGWMVFCRLIQGIGMGMMYPVKTAVVMKWFPSNERLVMNAVTLASAYLGFFFLFQWILGIYGWVGKDWHMTLTIIGFIALAAVILWVLFYKEQYPGLPSAAQAGTRAKGAAFSLDMLKEVMRNKYIIFMTIGVFGHYCAWGVVSNFFKPFFMEKFANQVPKDQLANYANGIMSVLPAAATIAIVAASLVAIPAKNRKLFIWPFQVGMLIGIMGAVFSNDVTIVRICQIVIGVCSAGWYPAFTTLCMELPGFNPIKVGVAMGVIFGVGNLTTFLISTFGGAMADAVGLKTMLYVISLISMLLPIVFFMKLPESHGRPMVEIPSDKKSAQA